MAADTPIVNLSKETLDQITPALHSMRDSLKNQTRLLQKTFDLQQASMQDADRRANLAQSQIASIDPEVTSSSTSNSSNTSGGTFIAGGGLMMPAAIALVASIAGFDDLLRAIALPKMIKGFGENLDKLKTNLNSISTRITDFGAKIKNFKFPDLPTIGFVDKTGAPYDFSKINARLTAPFDTLNTKVDEILTPATESIAKSVDDFKLTTTAWFDSIKTSAVTKLS